MDQQEEPCPYVGLQPFTETHQKYFYGRSRDARVIAANLCASALTVLYGPSGVGKSSVLQARVIPRLRSSSPSPIVLFRDWQGRFLDNLKRECIRTVESKLHRPLNIGQSVPFDELLLITCRASGNSILFVLDQFEEYLLYHPESASDDAFGIELARSINREDIDANFLIALREDALSKLDRFQLRIPNLLGNPLRLNHLDASGAEEAIRKPLEIYKRDAPPPRGPIEIEDDLVVEILDQVRPERLHISETIGAGRAPEVAEKGEIATPFLQLVATRLWEEEAKRGSSKLRLETLQNLGQVNGIVRTHLDDTMQRLSPNEKEVASRVFHYLVTPSGTKIAQTVEDLEGYTHLDKQSLGTIVEKLSKGDKRILTSVPLPEQPNRHCYQIFHDVLAPAILAWRARFVKEQEIVEAKKLAALEETEKRKKLLRVGLGSFFIIIVLAIFLILYSTMRATDAELETIRVQSLLDQARKAQEELEQALSKKRAAKKAEADSIYNKGYKAMFTNATKEAMEDFTTALNLYQELDDRPNQVRTLIGIGKIYTLREQYPDAKRAL